MANWSKKSLQQIFNHVSRHLIDQGKRATFKLDEVIYCTCYDIETDRRCAWGCLLPIKHYRENTIHIRTEYINYTQRLVKLNLEQFMLMTDLRECHDYIKPCRWKQRLRAIARKYNLTIPDYLVI